MIIIRNFEVMPIKRALVATFDSNDVDAQGLIDLSAADESRPLVQDGDMFSCDGIGLLRLEGVRERVSAVLMLDRQTTKWGRRCKLA